MSGNNGERVIAVVSPRSIGGVSLFDSTTAITQKNVGQFDSAVADIEATAASLTKLGLRGAASRGQPPCRSAAHASAVRGGVWRQAAR